MHVGQMRNVYKIFWKILNKEKNMGYLDVDGSIIFEIFHNKTNKYNNVTIMFLHTTCHNSVMFRFTSIIFRAITDIDKTYAKTWMDQ